MTDAWERYLEEIQGNEPWHNRRYLLSLEYLFSFGTLKPACRVAELGGSGPFTKLLRRFGSAIDIVSFEGIDLRNRFFLSNRNLNIYPSLAFDLVLCMEVIEHVQDREPQSIEEAAAFTGSGIQNMLAESFRILRPGGHLFVTTPNVCSLKNLEQLLDHVHPYFFRPHHRELSIRDVREFGESAGFVTRELVTKNVWDYHQMSKEKVEHLRNIINFAGSSPENREDDIFALFQKPAH